ncbi:hypothetical protein RP20_CCG022667 [Aedes albopictus]|nr:hypothetical protein RP20_CCG022667 [Aedes albopictus]
MLILLVLLITLNVASSRASNPCIFQLNPNSTGIGILNETFTGTEHCVYLGVRYALPPTGIRRFQNPELYIPSGPQNYTTFGSICPQWDDMNHWGKLLGDEDCLFLNIYVPQEGGGSTQDPQRPRYPVLVYVHGGSFVIGSGRMFATHGGDLLMDHGVVVVAINYRLSALGFLRIPEWKVAGNFGLKDQRVALRWIQQNIAAFGGDPECVTLLGHSAGAAAAAHHLYFTGSRGLFHRLILMGGSNLVPFGLRYAQESNVTEKVMSAFNVTSLEELQLIDYREFHKKYIFEHVPFMNQYSPYFIPTVEEGSEDSEAFIIRPPHELVKQKPAMQVPILMGLTATEFEKILYYRDQFFLGRNFPSNGGVDRLKEAMIHKVVTQRLKNATNPAAVIEKLANMANVYYPTKQMLRHLANFQGDLPVYYYRFEFDGRFGYCKYEYSKALVRERFYGAIHGDDLAYVFSPYIVRQALTNRTEFQKEWKVHERVVELVSNFVKFGYPTPQDGMSVKWPAYNSNGSRPMYLNIDDELEVRVENDERDEYYRLWELTYQCMYYNECKSIELLANNGND